MKLILAITLLALPSCRSMYDQHIAPFTLGKIPYFQITIIRIAL